MKYYFYLILFFQLIPAGSHAQIITNNNSFDEEHFLLEVKQIDEFIERFNDDKNSFIRRKIKKYYPTIKITRPLLIKTLFDSHNKEINIASKKSFINTSINIKHPCFLNFYKSGWFAEAICSIVYKNKPIDISILLKISANSDLASKWMICQVRSKDIDRHDQNFLVRKSKNSKKFLSPMCHATNFTCLNDAFDDISHVNDYLDKSFFKDDQSLSFYQALLNREINFQYVKYVRYHFFQVKGWYFTVDELNRNNTLNSGWLITNLKKSKTTDLTELTAIY